MIVSPEIAKIIRFKAAAEWPDDFEMQRHVIEEQTEAAEKMTHYQQNLDTTNEVVENCLRKALTEWPDDYEMMLHVLTEQVAAWEELYG